MSADMTSIYVIEGSVVLVDNLQRYKFCPMCGGVLRYQLRHSRERLTCQACGYIMYENPIVGVACIVLKNNRILLGRRAVGITFAGKWCIPCGYVEYDEDVYAAAIREFKEETGLEVIIDNVFTVLSNFHNPQSHTVGIWFCTHVAAGELQPGDDIDAVSFYELDNIPDMAFPTDLIVIEKLKGM